MPQNTHSPPFLNPQDDPRPELTADRLLLNEAIREYLEFSGYRHTASVFAAEAGQPSEPLQRDYLAQKLNLPVPKAKTRVEPPIPLLYSLFARGDARGEVAADRASRIQQRTKEAARSRDSPLHGERKVPYRVSDRKPAPVIFTGGSSR